MSQLFFVINQHLLDGTAHSLYCLRHCWWLAKTRPAQTVTLLFPGSGSTYALLQRFGFEPLPNLHLRGLPAVRRRKHGKGLTLDAVFYWSATWHLSRHSLPGDFLVTASFPKLFRFLLNRRGLSRRLRPLYEVHQLYLLDQGTLTDKGRFEFAVLNRAERLITTSGPLLQLLKEHLPGKPICNLGLACGFDPETFPPARALAPDLTRPFTVGYIGSLYAKQGVEWLVAAWPGLQLEFPTRLEIAGGSQAQIQKLRTLSGGNPHIVLHGPVSHSALPAFLEKVDALIIPALPEGRMPHVALTKAYDYLSFKRPILACDLPSVREVLRPDREALLFAPAQAGSLAAALRRLATCPQLGLDLVEAARERRAAFSWETRAHYFWNAICPTPSP